MKPGHRILLLYLVLCIVAAAAAGYGYLVGFPKTIDGRRVHRVTQRDPHDWFQPVLVYYAYNAAGREMKHGPFRRYEDGEMIQSAYFKDDRLEGTQSIFNVLGDKMQEIYFHNGQPYGWANFSKGKLLRMRKDVFRQGRAVAVENFSSGQYALEFRCGELINAQIDPASGQISPIPNPSRHACVEP